MPIKTMDDNWVKRISSRRGLVYFFNTKTGESRWESPENVTSNIKAPRSEQQNNALLTRKSDGSSRDMDQRNHTQCRGRKSNFSPPKPQRTSPRRGTKRPPPLMDTEHPDPEAKKRSARTSSMCKLSETSYDSSQKRLSPGRKTQKAADRSQTPSVSPSDMSVKPGNRVVPSSSNAQRPAETVRETGRCLRSNSATMISQDFDSSSERPPKKKRKKRKKSKKKKKIKEDPSISTESGEDCRKTQTTAQIAASSSCPLSTSESCDSKEGNGRSSNKEQRKAIVQPVIESQKNNRDPKKNDGLDKKAINDWKIPKLLRNVSKDQSRQVALSSSSSMSETSLSSRASLSSRTSEEDNSVKRAYNSGGSSKGSSVTKDPHVLQKLSQHSSSSNREQIQSDDKVARDEDFEMEVDFPAVTQEVGTKLGESLDSSAQLASSPNTLSATQHCPSFVSEEESQMEVDFPSVTEGKVLVIVDTNVLINNISFVQNIKGKAVQGLGEILLVIPWMVMQELDGLKGPSCNPASHVSLSARKALGFLHKNRGDPSIRGQSYHHFSKKTEKRKEDNSDDRILQYCLQCKKKYSKNLVVMLTNDKNLAVKASFSGVPSSGCSNFEEDIRKQVSLRKELSFSSDDAEPEVTSPDIATSGHTLRAKGSKEVFLPSACSSTSDLLGEISVQELKSGEDVLSMPDDPVTDTGGSEGQSSSSSASTNQNQIPRHPSSDVGEGKERQTTTSTTSGVISQDRGVLERKEEKYFTKEMLLSLKTALAVVLRKEMMDAYTNHWLEIVHKKPPWSLLDILECFKKHFMAVFGLLVGREKKDDICQLITIIRDVGKDGSFDSLQRKCFHSKAGSLLERLSETPKYKSICLQSKMDLQKTYNSWISYSSTHKSSQRGGGKPTQEKSTAQKGEEITILPTTTTPSTSYCSEQGPIRDANFQWDRGADGRSKGDECDGGKGLVHSGLAEIAFTVLSIFEAIWTMLQSHRDTIASSFQYLSSGRTPEGVPQRQESLSHLRMVIPLVEPIVDSLQRLMMSSNPTQMLLSVPVVESIHTFTSRIMVGVDVGPLQPELFQQFVSVAENRERLAVGTQQLTELLQQLRECLATLSQL